MRRDVRLPAAANINLRNELVSGLRVTVVTAICSRAQQSRSTWGLQAALVQEAAPPTKGFQRMRKTSVSLAVLGVAAAMSLAACGSSSNDNGSSSSSSSASSSAARPARPAPERSTARAPRSASSCPTPRPRRAGSPPTRPRSRPTAQKYNLDCNIQNAGGSASKMQTIAQPDGVRRRQGPHDRQPRRRRRAPRSSRRPPRTASSRSTTTGSPRAAARRSTSPSTT